MKYISLHFLHLNNKKLPNTGEGANSEECSERRKCYTTETLCEYCGATFIHFCGVLPAYLFPLQVFCIISSLKTLQL